MTWHWCNGADDSRSASATRAAILSGERSGSRAKRLGSGMATAASDAPSQRKTRSMERNARRCAARRSKLDGKVKVQLFQHLGTGDAAAPFSTTPSYQAKVSLDSGDFERWKARNSAFLHEDLDGDGVAELYVLEKTRSGHRFAIRKGRRDVGGYAASEAPQWAGEVEGVESVTVRTLRDGASQVIVFVRATGFAFAEFR